MKSPDCRQHLADYERFLALVDEFEIELAPHLDDDVEALTKRVLSDHPDGTFLPGSAGTLEAWISGYFRV